MMRQTGKIKEEIVILAHKSDASQEGAPAIVRVIDMKALSDEFNNEQVC